MRLYLNRILTTEGGETVYAEEFLPRVLLAAIAVPVVLAILGVSWYFNLTAPDTTAAGLLMLVVFSAGGAGLSIWLPLRLFYRNRLQILPESAGFRTVTGPVWKPAAAETARSAVRRVILQTDGRGLTVHFHDAPSLQVDSRGEMLPRRLFDDLAGFDGVETEDRTAGREPAPPPPFPWGLLGAGLLIAGSAGAFLSMLGGDDEPQPTWRTTYARVVGVTESFTGDTMRFVYSVDGTKYEGTGPAHGRREGDLVRVEYRSDVPADARPSAEGANPGDDRALPTVFGFILLLLGVLLALNYWDRRHRGAA